MFGLPRLNPMYHLIQMFRTPIYEGRIPDLEAVLLTRSRVFTIVTLIVGLESFLPERQMSLPYRI